MTLQDVAKIYAVAVSPTILALIDPADPADPIARQFLPRPGGIDGDGRKSLPIPSATRRIRRSQGIVHRHPDRVLFKAVAACPVYCRFCFRREMIGPGKGNALSPSRFDGGAGLYRSAIREIWEVILTGGDPFILSPRRMARDHQRAGGHRSCQDRSAGTPACRWSIRSG